MGAEEEEKRPFVPVMVDFSFLVLASRPAGAIGVAFARKLHGSAVDCQESREADDKDGLRNGDPRDEKYQRETMDDPSLTAHDEQSFSLGATLVKRQET